MIMYMYSEMQEEESFGNVCVFTLLCIFIMFMFKLSLCFWLIHIDYISIHNRRFQEFLSNLNNLFRREDTTQDSKSYLKFFTT